MVTLLTGSAVVDGLECNATGPVIPIGVLGGDDPAAVRAVELAIDLAYEALGVVINVTVWKPGCTDDATDDMAAFDSAGVAAYVAFFFSAFVVVVAVVMRFMAWPKPALGRF